ncbi:cGMP-dependent protein kinase 2 [Saguinus oedipus]|uniref:cGMP-dependent protein kinase 2 n=1 Tax=Saguinus oedipus TaxID=9490 RepID=A0ABQ9W2P9_SAGOE|nr:cGMP-dependent protein kinase 2 [Saguinus oedipus]
MRKFIAFQTMMIPVFLFMKQDRNERNGEDCWEVKLHLTLTNSVPFLRYLSKMGNGSVKPKHSKHPDGHSGNLTTDALRNKVTELERELRRKDAEIQEREYHLKELREQLSKQTVAIAELTEELQNKCIQLNKLQDVVHMQGGSPLQASPDKVPLEVHRKTSGLVSLHSRRGAKAGVSAEPTTRTYDLNKPPEFSFEKARVRKDSSEKKLITDALNKNQFLKRLDPQQIKDMVECMYGRNYQQGSYIIKQGEPGNHIFVLAEGVINGEGRLEVFQGEKLLSSIPMWTTFGELAILYNCTRTASVKAITNVKTWTLDREVFQNIMRRTAQARDEQYRNFLRSVSLLKNLPEDKLTKIIDCLEVETRSRFVIKLKLRRDKEATKPVYFVRSIAALRPWPKQPCWLKLPRCWMSPLDLTFLSHFNRNIMTKEITSLERVKKEVKVTQSTEGHDQPQLIKTLQKGEYFGEKALIR